MDGTNMVSATPTPAPASFTPDQDDLDEMHPYL
jgi:hypothetical protein